MSEVQVRTTETLKQLLREKFPAPEYSLIFEVPDGTSNNLRRRADALAFGCWKSKSLHLTGFEIKVSRGDWLREVKDVSKADAWKQHCHCWYLVTFPNIVKPEELPGDWGLMVATKRGLTIKRPSVFKSQPLPIPYSKQAALARRFMQSSPETITKQRLQEAYNRGHSEGYQLAETTRQKIETPLYDKIAQLQNQIRDFRALSGIDISRLETNIAVQFRAFMRLWPNVDGIDSAIVRLNNTIDDLQQLKAAVGESLPLKLKKKKKKKHGTTSKTKDEAETEPADEN